MANDIQVSHDSGVTLYAVIRNRNGQVWCPTQDVFEDWGADGRGADDYDITLIDRAGSLHVGDFDPSIPGGRYILQVFIQSGANPADADGLLTSREIVWSGAAEVTPMKILANKAIYDKVSGSIDYYDDDGTTVILSHTTSDETSTLTRDPN